MESKFTYHEHDIILNISRGDVNSFRRFFDRYRNELYTYCLKLTKEKAGAEEIVQDVFTIIWSHRHELNPQLPIKPYLYAITKNRALNFLRKNDLDKRLKKEVHYVSEKITRPEDDLDYQDTRLLLEQALQQMPEGQREVFFLSREKGMSREEIASALNTSKNTVKDQLYKALKHIRNYLNTSR